MNYVEFIDKWSIASRESIRVDNSHPLDFYLSKGEQNESKLLFIAGKKNINVKDSDIIKVKVGKRNDLRYAYSFILRDQSFQNQFYRLCYDLIDSSRNFESNEESYKYVIILFLKWQRMMKASKGNILCEEEIKGLIAELIIFHKLLKSQIDKTELINSWLGPEGYYQDYVFPKIWYEVKAITKRSEKITISSLQQLDVENEGKIYTVILDKIEVDTVTSTTLNSIIKVIEFEFRDDILLIERFKDKLIKVGYFYSDEYDNFIYEVNKIKTYNVDNTFPRIRKNELPIEIGKVKYELILSCLNNWLMGEEIWNYKNLERES